MNWPHFASFYGHGSGIVVTSKLTAFTISSRFWKLDDGGIHCLPAEDDWCWEAAARKMLADLRALLLAEDAPYHW